MAMMNTSAITMITRKTTRLAPKRAVLGTPPESACNHKAGTVVIIVSSCRSSWLAAKHA
jgi:hypothetical protein